MEPISILRRPDGLYVLDIQRASSFRKPKVGEESVEGDEHIVGDFVSNDWYDDGAISVPESKSKNV